MTGQGSHEGGHVLAGQPLTTTRNRDRKADVAGWHPAAGALWYVKPSITATLGYDTRGNRTSTTPATGPALGYGYDQANRLISAPGATYAYNGDGLRMAKTVGGATSSFTWDPSGPLPLVVDDGTNSYIYGPGGLPLEHIDRSGAVTWYHHDQLGSTRTLTSSTGAVVGTATYDPYGRPPRSPTPTGPRPASAPSPTMPTDGAPPWSTAAAPPLDVGLPRAPAHLNGPGRHRGATTTTSWATSRPSPTRAAPTAWAGPTTTAWSCSATIGRKAAHVGCRDHTADDPTRSSRVRT